MRFTLRELVTNQLDSDFCTLTFIADPPFLQIVEVSSKKKSEIQFQLFHQAPFKSASLKSSVKQPEKRSEAHSNRTKAPGIIRRASVTPEPIHRRVNFSPALIKAASTRLFVPTVFLYPRFLFLPCCPGGFPFRKTYTTKGAKRRRDLSSMMHSRLSECTTGPLQKLLITIHSCPFRAVCIQKEGYFLKQSYMGLGENKIGGPVYAENFP